MLYHEDDVARGGDAVCGLVAEPDPRSDLPGSRVSGAG